jgi:hypothetical protein
MKRRVSMVTRNEILRALADRYRNAKRLEKTRVLDELVAITGYHRKHAIRLLGGRAYVGPSETTRVGRRIYDDAVKEALIVMWEAADRICGRRLKVVIPSFVENMERHGHLCLDPVVRDKLLSVSAATIDRLLAPVRARGRGRRKRRRRPNALLKRQIPVRTFSDWHNEPPGFCEADFVAHNGGVIAGSCVHSLVATDVSSGWTECLPLVVRQQALVVEALEVLQARLPFPLLGLDTDNDGAFMNESVFDFCRGHQIELTRSREYRKNDQAWIEQKNGSVVRRLVGYGRFTGIVATHTLGRLYQLSRLYVNFFQPSFKLRSKTREGAKVRKTYFKPATPCDRLLNSKDVSEPIKENLREQRRALDPVRLLHGIRELQATLCALAKSPGSEHGEVPASQSLDTFLAALPQLWRDGEARPTHRTKRASPRTWRTRADPFKDVWPEMLGRLQDEPDATAKELFERLRRDHPGDFQPGQLRTLQRRVREWRHAMARELIYAGLGDMDTDPRKTSPAVTLFGNIPG